MTDGPRSPKTPPDRESAASEATAPDRESAASEATPPDHESAASEATAPQPADNDLDQEMAAGEAKSHALMARFADLRADLDARPVLRLVYRIVVAVVGAAVILAGIAMLALPGPGWLTIFLGLGILATEFSAFHRLNLWARKTVRRWWLWARARWSARRGRPAQRTGPASPPRRPEA